MTSVLLVYPYFKPRRDRSVFRFPPLGISYLAASLQAGGHTVSLLDCTFLDRRTALPNARAARAEVVGIYCWVTMMEDCAWLAAELRPTARLLVAGGPLPTCDPLPFLEHFDVVVRGEGEQTLLELLAADAAGSGLETVPGLVFNRQAPVFTPERRFEKDLDRLPFPARDLLPNASYIAYGRKKYGTAVTTVMSTRGCPFRCEFCSNVVFGGSYREHSPGRVVDEVEQALALGYERISFADDVFTMKRERVVAICREILRRGLHFEWECLGRVDSLDEATALEMKQAGCSRIYFGIESGDEAILELMNKKTTVPQARLAVEAAHAAGLQVGAFFILCYPGDTDETVLETLRFATSLPLDYLGLSMPYPLPGTALYDRVRERVTRAWRPDDSPFGSHVLIVEAGFSEAKVWFALAKGRAQFLLKRWLGKRLPFAPALFEKTSDALFRRLP